LKETSPYYKVYDKPEISDSSFIVCWDDDAGKLGVNVFRYLSEGLDLKLFAEIEPTDYFSLSGVSVEKDVAMFPESRFYYLKGKNLVIFKSALPRFEWHRFISSVLDISEKVCKAKEILTVGGMVAISSHNIPRSLMATTTSPEIKTSLSSYGIDLNMDYETPAGQRPTLSSYLLWSAIGRQIPGISLWVPVPFYMVNIDDFSACRKLLDFINKWLDLGLDMKEIDKATSVQNKKIIDISKIFPELQEIFHKLESNITLNQSETDKIMELMEDRLK